MEELLKLLNEKRGLIGVLTLVGLVVTGAWTVDARYAKAADLTAIQRQANTASQNMSLELRIRLNEQSISGLQDRLDDLEKDRLTPDELRRKGRYKQRVQDLQNENNQLRQQQFELNKPQ